MNKVKIRYLFVTFSIFLLTIPTLSVPIIPPYNPSSKSQVDSTVNPDIITSSTINIESYNSKNVILIGTSTVYSALTFINCNIQFSNKNSEYNATGLHLGTGSSLTIIDSNISMIQPDEYFNIIGYGSNSIYIINSTITSNSNPPTPVMNFINSKYIFISNSSFFNTQNLFQFQNGQDIIISGSAFYNNGYQTIRANNIDKFTFDNNSFKINPNFNNKTIDFTNIPSLKVDFNSLFQTDVKLNISSPRNYPIFITNCSAVTLAHNLFSNLKNIMLIQESQKVDLIYNQFYYFQMRMLFDSHFKIINIFQNTVSKRFNSIILNSLYPEMHLNITLNNFYNISQVVLIHNFTKSQLLTGDNVSYNYYVPFNSIDFNNDGFYDKSYITKYFIDVHPLSYPSEDYSVESGSITLNSNYRESNLLNNTNSFQFFTYKWSFLILYYSGISLLPIIVLMLLRRKRSST